MIRQEVNEYSEKVSSLKSVNNNKSSQTDDELKVTIAKRSLGVMTKDNELKEKDSRYKTIIDVNTKAIKIENKLKDAVVIMVNLRNGNSHNRQNDSK